MAGLLDGIAPDDEILPPSPQTPLWLQVPHNYFRDLAWAAPRFPPNIQPPSNGQNQMMPPPYDPTQYPRNAWSATKAFGQGAANVLLWEPGEQLGGALQSIAEGQGTFGDYAEAGMGIAAAVPALGAAARAPKLAMDALFGSVQ